MGANQWNENIFFSILLQGVVDTKRYFTSINPGALGSIHDGIHFKFTLLHRKAEEGNMGGLNGNPMTLLVARPFASYIVRDYGYPLMSWYMTSFKVRPLGIFSMKYEHWFNRKHSSTCMSVERGSRI